MSERSCERHCKRYTHVLRLARRDLLDLLFRHLFLLHGREVVVLRERVVLLVAHHATFLCAHVPISVQACLLLLPLPRIQAQRALALFPW